jgi:hypothetical protein
MEIREKTSNKNNNEERNIMKFTSRKWSHGLGILALAGVLALVLGSSAKVVAESPENDAFGGAGLAGTWNVKITLTNCETGAVMGRAFSSVLSFAGDGTMAENTSNPGFAVGQRGPGLGVWSHTGWHAYHAKSVAFILFTTPPAPPMNPGFTMGTQTISQNIKLDGPDEFTSDATIEFADTTGNGYRNGCAVAAATRFQ